MFSAYVMSLFAASRAQNIEHLDTPLTNSAWQMQMDVHDQKNYLNYAESRLKPITIIKTDYKNNPKLDEPGFGEPQYWQQYEDIWYHAGHAIGLRRHTSADRLQGLEGRTGTILVSTGDDVDQSHVSAIANALVRVSMEIELTTDVAGYRFLVPLALYDQLDTSIKAIGFSPVPMSGEAPQFSFIVASYPSRKTTTYFYYSSSE